MDATRDEAEPSGKGCETADAPGSFTSNVWNLSSIFLLIVTFKVQTLSNRRQLPFSSLIFLLLSFFKGLVCEI